MDDRPWNAADWPSSIVHRRSSEPQVTPAKERLGLKAGRGNVLWAALFAVDDAQYRQDLGPGSGHLLGGANGLSAGRQHIFDYH
jgi:hypothetical protein